jgi:hypothetical protein
MERLAAGPAFRQFVGTRGGAGGLRGGGRDGRLSQLAGGHRDQGQPVCDFKGMAVPWCQRASENIKTFETADVHGMEFAHSRHESTAYFWSTPMGVFSSGTLSHFLKMWESRHQRLSSTNPHQHDQAVNCHTPKGLRRFPTSFGEPVATLPERRGNPVPCTSRPPAAKTAARTLSLNFPKKCVTTLRAGDMPCEGESCIEWV